MPTLQYIVPNEVSTLKYHWHMLHGRNINLFMHALTGRFDSVSRVHLHGYPFQERPIWSAWFPVCLTVPLTFLLRPPFSLNSPPRARPAPFSADNNFGGYTCGFQVLLVPFLCWINVYPVLPRVLGEVSGKGIPGLWILNHKLWTPQHTMYTYLGLPTLPLLVTPRPPVKLP